MANLLKLKEEQGEAAAAKAEPGIHVPSRGGHPVMLSCTRGERKPAPGTQPAFAAWHMLQTMTGFTYLSPHGLMETGFWEHFTHSCAVTCFQCLPCHITACLCVCYDLKV